MTLPEHFLRHRRPGVLVAVAVLVVSTLPGLVAAGPVAADAIADKRAEAERIAEALEAQRDRVSILAEDLNEARLEAERIAGELATAKQELGRTEAEVGRATSVLKDRLVNAYAHGGGPPPVLALLIGGPVDEMAVRRTYVEVVAGQEQAAIDDLEVAREQHEERRQEMEAAQRSADGLAEQVASRRREAERAVEAERATLARVNGDLAGLVEAERVRRAEAEAQKAKAELEARLARETKLAREKAASSTTTTTTVAAKGATTTTTKAGAEGGEDPDPSEEPDEAAQDEPAGPPAAGAATAIAEARRQLGKPYEYGSPGPDSFDCSGLTSWAWRAAGKSLPHSSRAQMSITATVSVGAIEPGDLVFYGSPVHHVGLYAGNGQMIEASETGTPVRVASIYRRDLVGVGRVK